MTIADTFSVPWLPSQHPECLLSVPAAGRMHVVRPGIPWSADGTAAQTPHWRDPNEQVFKKQHELSINNLSICFLSTGTTPGTSEWPQTLAALSKIR